MTDEPYLVLAYYSFETIADPKGEVEIHKNFFKGRDATARIYISEQGINGQLSAAKKDALAYMEWMKSRAPFENIHFKAHPYHEQVFVRLTVKYRKQLVALDKPVDLAKRGKYLSPKEWEEKLDKEEDPLLIDVRNDYEWKVGRFAKSKLPKCNTFREFDSYANNLKKTHNPKTPVMMYCTGGIRCELYSALLKEKGFEEVYQLQGGVINYGLEVGAKHWEGKLFVFDDRMTIPISDEQAPVIGKCHHCGTANETYYNCANMDCNELFLSCSECLKKTSGCCKQECKNSPRVRPYHEQNPHKPFRRKHLIRSSSCGSTKESSLESQGAQPLDPA